MSNDTTESKPLPVTAVQPAVADMIVDCARDGTVKVDDTNSVCSAELMQGIWGNNFVAWNTSNKVTLIVLNRLDKPLTLKTNGFASADHEGFQYRHPASLVSGDRDTGTYVDRDIIPGLASGAANAGLYYFEGYSPANIFRHHYVSGALEFTSESATDSIAIGFYIYPGENSVTATANFSRWTSLDDFAGMYATGAGVKTCSSVYGPVTVHGSVAEWSPIPKSVDADYQTDCFVVTLAVVPS